jgi:hypothetical protein
MLTVVPKKLENQGNGLRDVEASQNKRNLPDHGGHGDDYACAYVDAIFSGLPKALRDHGRLMVLQAWFDESGKDGQTPVYLLAGYVADKETWKNFADEWQAELGREPRLPYLHVKEGQLFKGMTALERENRLLRFVEIIRQHKPLGITFMLKHSDYSEFARVISTHPNQELGETDA